jgi:hypothetical protein
VRLSIIALLAAGCGRIGFDPLGALGDDTSEVLPVTPVPLAEIASVTCIDVVWTGQDLGVFWTNALDNRLHFARVALDGSILVPERLLAAVDPSCPSVIWTGTSYAVVWHANGSDVVLGLVDTAGAQTAEVTVATGGNSQATIGWDGSVIGVSFIDLARSSRFRAFAANGSSLGSVVGLTTDDFLARISGRPTGGFAYVHAPQTRAEYVELDQAGSPTTAPLFVCDRLGVRALANGPTRFAAVYEGNNFEATVRTGTSALANPPVTLSPGDVILADMVSVSDGFALVWIDDTTGESNRGELRFTRIDASGTPSTPIYRLADFSIGAAVAAIDDTTFAVAFEDMSDPLVAVFQVP